ncbi:hypothetical protein TRIUR3_35289 [Triticum urartu]|uniref:F-box associated beta-propeller type 3 domain-containing protein n=2 Tax=Triticum urartu TaxID=4572 RepID=M7YSB1_TRIUA|nr:hypothetical protein TRIUR3_35289 [Triticum urartu]
MGVNGTFPKKSANDARKIKKRKSQRMQRTGSVPQRKQRTMSLQPIREQLLDVMVWEILIRLPVESLVRFKLVSKAWCHRNMLQHSTCLPIGFGLDVSTGTYKVARSFYRSCDCSSVAMGMEVFTINGDEGNWRETLLDPPYPIICPQTAIHCKGSLFYFIDKKIQQCPPQALLRFCLQDETFGITPLLNNVYPTVEDDDDIVLHELDGELCATFFSKCVQRVLDWVARDIVNPEWDCHYVINVSDHCCPVASLSIAGRFLLRRGHCLIHYYMKAHGVKEEDIFDMDDLRFLGPIEDTLGHAWKNLCVFELLYYTTSLVSITPKASLQAS